MAHDPMDVHVDKDAFWAAYKALQDAGVSFADVRADTANRVAVAVLERRTMHGLGFMLELTQSSEVRKALVEQLATDTPKMFTSVTRRALDESVAGAALALGGGPS